MAYYPITEEVPAYLPNDPDAMAAWQAWRARNRAVTRANVNATMDETGTGWVSPDALKAQTQGGRYTVEQQRNAIANAIVKQLYDSGRDSGGVSGGSLYDYKDLS